jgi:thiamine-phosphate pyrophosphorylase
MPAVGRLSAGHFPALANFGTLNAMRYELTPAAERALEQAANWTGPDDSHAAVSLLLGLLAEGECRAAQMLSSGGVDRAKVAQRWPEVTRRKPSKQRRLNVEHALDLVIGAALERLTDFGSTIDLATEHLLLGITASRGDVSEWLKEQGCSADSIEAAIHRLYRHDASPIDVDLDESGGNRAPQQVERSVGNGASPADATGRGLPSAATSAPAWRILDASANRAREGLRVVEDYVRFVRNDQALTASVKQLRHDLSATLALLPSKSLMASRDTPGDVGTEVSTPSEQHRSDLGAVAKAALKRTQEALRSLEEYSKLLDRAASARFEQLRYRCYTLESAVAAERAVDRLAQARLYVLIDGANSLDEFERRVELLLSAGVDVIQLRDKSLADRKLLERAHALRRLTRNTATLFIMNDRADLARLADADGVHLGQDELSVADARRIVGPAMLVGMSTHAIEQARQGVADGADYLGVGPTFPSTTKTFEQFTGVELLRAVAAEITLPAFAIGGITVQNVDQVRAAGICRIAVSGAVANATDCVATCRELLTKLS